MNAEVTRTKTAVIVTIDHIEMHLDRENALRLAAQLTAAARGLEGAVLPTVRCSGFAVSRGAE